MPVKACVDEKSTCDVCKGQLTRCKTFSDASLSLFGGSWAWVCQFCADSFGAQYGTGKGQKYSSETLEKLEG